MSKFPQIYARDSGKRITVDTIVKLLGDAIDCGASVYAFCDIIDRYFIDGAWAGELDIAVKEVPQLHFFLKDVRGLIVAAYNEGYKRGASQYSTGVDV